MIKCVNIAVGNKMSGRFLKMESTCVCCGAEIPEGWMACPDCMYKARLEAVHRDHRKTEEISKEF